MTKIIINSSLVPEYSYNPDMFSDDAPCVVTIPIPEDIVNPQFVNGSWQEYSIENDPAVN